LSGKTYVLPYIDEKGVFIFRKFDGNKNCQKMSTQNNQIAQIRSAIQKVVAVGPDFLNHKIAADEMAHTMVKAVDDYVALAQKEGSLQPQSNEAEELQGVLSELKGCGSGFLADRCDDACVARTITYMVNEFGE